MISSATPSQAMRASSASAPPRTASPIACRGSVEASTANESAVDALGTTTQLAAAGATVIDEPHETPWRSLDSRLDAPAGLQLTIFEKLEDAAHQTQHPGFGTSTDR